MQMQQDTIRLLILDPSQNDAEDLINLLRNSGHATQAQMVESPQQLADLFKQKNWDLCFASNRSVGFTPFQLQSEIKKLEQDIPVILLTEEDDSDILMTALEAGIKDAVPMGQHPRLLLVALRELANLYERRAKRKAQIGLRDAEKRCRLLLDNSKDAIAYAHDGMHIYANEAYVKLFGYPDFDELEGMPLMDMVSGNDQDGLKSFLRAYREGKNDADNFVCNGIRDDSSLFEINMEFSSAKYDGESCTQIFIRTDGGDAPSEGTSKQDVLTGLKNQAAFIHQVDKAIEQALENSDNSAVLFIQLDDIMSLKSRLGPASTNLILGDVARTLAKMVTGGNILARYDDFGFAALLPGCDPDSAGQAGEKLCAAIAANTSQVSGENIKVTASTGIAILNENTTSASNVINKAREAASFVKTNTGSGDGVHIHSSDEQEAAHEAQIADQLQNALDNELFKLVFQPVVSLRGDSGEHYEVLLRMPDAEGNDVSPSEFIHTATDRGLLARIERWVIENSIYKLKKHLDEGHKTHTFINVSGDSILDSSLLPWISELLNETRLPGDSIIFQVSETDATAHLTEAKEFVKGINQLQCKAALTHFGRALNPFNNLKHLPVSYVKIDSSFITEVNKNADSKDDIKNLVSALHIQGKLTIAPMVDSAGLLPVLWQAGINYIQGYYIQQPSKSMDYDFSTEDDED